MLEHSEINIDRISTKTSGGASPTTGESPDEVLTREIGMARWLTPSGRQVVHVRKGSLHAFRLEGQGAQPVESAIWYTSRHRLVGAVEAYLRKFWDISDSVGKKKQSK